MATSNKVAREKLIAIYGKKSMFQESGAEKYIEGLKRIRTYKKFLEKKKFKGKKINLKQLQYHHMKHRSEGGRATVENGALVYDPEHSYMHSLPRQQEEIINNHIRQYKIDFMILQNMQVKDSGILEQSEEEETIEIPVHTYGKMTKEQEEARQRREEKREYNRLRKEFEDRWIKT